MLAMLCFLGITAIKAGKYRRYPIHSRLELYPVPKEGKLKARYGGSYFEEAEWWDKPRTIDRANQTKDILGEMLLIRKLFQNNRSLWWISYVFHVGIYVMFAWTILLLLATLWPHAVFVAFVSFIGGFGFALATVGAIGLLVRRVLDSTLKAYTTPQEYFNIILILLVLVTGIISWGAVSSPFEVALGLLTFSGLELAPLVIVHLILLGVMLIYIPVSKMSHYVGKFFAFHKVLWDNDPNQQGSQVNERLKKAASAAPATTQAGWSASHISPAGLVSDDASNPDKPGEE